MLLADTNGQAASAWSKKCFVHGSELQVQVGFATRAVPESARFVFFFFPQSLAMPPVASLFVVVFI